MSDIIEEYIEGLNSFVLNLLYKFYLEILG